MEIKPLENRVVVKRVEQDEKTAGGIVLPGTASEKPQRGEIKAVGPGKRSDAGDLQAMTVKVGDQVLFGKYSGNEIQVDGEDLLIMREDDLLAIVS